MNEIIKETIETLKRNRFLTFASLGTIIASMFIFGIFCIFYLNINYLSANLQRQVQIEAYLKDNITTNDINILISEMEKHDAIEKVTYIDSIDASLRVNKMLEKQDVMINIEDLNLMPSSLEITLKDSNELENVVTYLHSIDEIDNIRYGEEILQNLASMSKVAKSLGLGLLVFLGIGIAFIINNMIRVIIYNKRKNIKIMQYLGATNNFIIAPFALSGAFIGFVGSFISFFLIKNYYEYIVGEILISIPFVKLLPVYPYIYYFGIVILLLGTMMGFAFSILSAKKHL